uniref:Uncharacterized protein n=1 Tax=Oryza meridionalis TaxID=40149 RepID=A0A0E0CI99_9ORYZ
MELPGVWRGLGYTKAGWRGRRCSGPTCQQRLSGGDERRVKTQPGLCRTDNNGSFPLLRALSCRLIP